MTTPAVIRAALRRPRPRLCSCRHFLPFNPSVVQPLRQQTLRPIHTTRPLHAPDRPTALTNMLASDVPPPVQVTSVGPAGIKLADGLVLTGPVVFLEGKVLLWDVPSLGEGSGGGRSWGEWTRAHWEVFDVVVPKPGRLFVSWFRVRVGRVVDRPLLRIIEILIFGTGARMELVPGSIRGYVKELGIQMDVMDTVGSPGSPLHCPF
jgi:NADH dehydrogenase [ubiquinone] 1 alpha subcomplex assembly factor 3